MTVENSEEKFLYFAFGSCMDEKDFSRTAPYARKIGLTLLEDYELVFNIWAVSRQGGVANIKEKAGEQVFGVLWGISKEELEALDIREAHPHVYERSFVTVTHKEFGAIEAITYIGRKFNELPMVHHVPTAAYEELMTNGLMDAFKEEYMAELSI